MAKSGAVGQKMETTPNRTMSNSLSSYALFSGQESYTLDEKGRVTVPKAWRKKDADSEEFYLVPDSAGACLRAMRPEHFAKLGDDARALPGMDAKKHMLFLRNFFSQSVLVSTDKQGRIAVPKDYCERFKLGGEIAMVGARDLFELWNKAALKERQKQEAPEFGHFADALGL